MNIYTTIDTITTRVTVGVSLHDCDSQSLLKTRMIRLVALSEQVNPKVAPLKHSFELLYWFQHNIVLTPIVIMLECGVYILIAGGGGGTLSVLGLTCTALVC